MGKLDKIEVNIGRGLTFVKNFKKSLCRLVTSGGQKKAQTSFNAIYVIINNVNFWNSALNIELQRKQNNNKTCTETGYALD